MATADARPEIDDVIPHTASHMPPMRMQPLNAIPTGPQTTQPATMSTSISRVAGRRIVGIVA